MTKRTPSIINFTEKRPELYLRILVTGECSNDCVYCFHEDETDFTSSSRDILTPDFFQVLAIVATKHGFPKIHFSGGEPLERQELPQFIKAIKQNALGLDIGLTTNGLSLEELAEELYDAGLERVNISIPTLQNDRYRTICKNGSADKVLAGVDKVRRLGLGPIKINIPLYRENVDEISDFMHYFLSIDDVFLRYFSLLHSPKLNADQTLNDATAIKMINSALNGLEGDLRAAAGRISYRPRFQKDLTMCHDCDYGASCHDNAKAIRIYWHGLVTLCLRNPEFRGMINNPPDIESEVIRLKRIYDKK